MEIKSLFHPSAKYLQRPIMAERVMKSVLLSPDGLGRENEYRHN